MLNQNGARITTLPKTSLKPSPPPLQPPLMALSRLIRAEVDLHKDFLRTRRWFCSAATRTLEAPSKKALNRELAKKKKTEAVKSFIERYMVLHPGVFPKLIQVQNEVRGSWYITKTILEELRRGMLPGSENKLPGTADACAATMSPFEAAESISEVRVIDERTDSCKLGRPEIGLKPLTEKLDTVECATVEKDATVSTAAKSSDNSQETVIHRQTPNHVSSGESNSSELLPGFFDFLKNNTEKGLETRCIKVNNPKHEKPSYSEEKNNHVDNLHDIFRRQLVSKDSNPSTPQSRSSYLTEECTTAEMKDLLQKIMELPKDKQTHGSCDNVPINKTNRLNKETRGFVSESLDFPNLVDRHQSPVQHSTLVGKPEVQTDVAASKEANISDFLVKEVREEQKESITDATVNRKLQSDKYRKTMDSSDTPYSEVTSDESDSEVAAFDYSKPASNVEVSLPLQGFNLNPCPDKETRSHMDSLMVKFLPKTAKPNDISLAFGDCGPIADIFIVPTRRENRYNYSYVRFKTQEGLRKALAKTDVAICGADVVMEPVSPSMRHNKEIHTESLTDADFPVNFLKNPVRTVMVQGLPDNISFQSLGRALSQWGPVSGLAMGSLSSSVYVEFQTEETKEMILAEATVSVSGTKLRIYRVDHPKTTVVRISNVNPLTGLARLRSICDSFGQVKRLVGRGININTYDVHFKLSEWTNMTKILNRMNGMDVDQTQWVVQPATVVPAEVLQTLWSEPGGRKHVLEMIRDLCRRIEEKSIDTTPLRNLAQEYYGNL